MQTCPRCRRSVAAEAAFCPHCGAQLRIQPLQGEIIDGTKRFARNRPLSPGRAARLSIVPGLGPWYAGAQPKSLACVAHGRGSVLFLIDVKLPDVDGRELLERAIGDPIRGAIPIWILSNSMPEDHLWWHAAPNVQRYFLKSQVVLSRLSLEIRATLGLPYGERISNRMAG